MYSEMNQMRTSEDINRNDKHCTQSNDVNPSKNVSTFL